MYASVPAPPVVDVNTYVVPSGGTYPRRYPWSSYLTLLLIYLLFFSSFQTQGDDAFFRRSSWNADQINAAAYASMSPPPIVDVAQCPYESGGDNAFFRRSSWNHEQIKAEAYASMPAPPILADDAKRPSWMAPSYPLRSVDVIVPGAC